MTMMKLLVVLACLATLGCAYGPADPPNYWITTVYEEGGTVVLDCYLQLNGTNNTDMLLEYHTYGWMWPDLTVVNLTYNDSRRWVENQLRFVITNVTHHDFGQYHCMLQHDVTYDFELVRLGLNLRGPFFADMWALYRMNTIIGICSTVGFLFLVVVFWLFWRYRWIDPEVKAAQNEMKEAQNDGNFITKLGPADGLDSLKAKEAFLNGGYVQSEGEAVFTIPDKKPGESSHGTATTSQQSASSSAHSSLTHRSSASGSAHGYADDMTML